ncbi:flagellar basal-body MS-ring/collar protein FliF [Ferviditalea candida]|uniref:Flagellar M-ring protein n=1 Tax=Ferviditalea candida TaxID=3108399 RepID=A0ABU5ZG04_9BACL|nr:flagellar basal-body MS-ring/collar protein FliF [Paenibacillaceae bacterium T2]
MNETIARYWGLTTQYWNRFEKKQKMYLISGVALLLIVIIILTYIFSRTEYVVAFTDLDSADAAAITGYLKGQGIPYKLSADGKSIGVPQTNATDVKINVESQGLMKNGSLGYGIFRDNISSLGMTDNEFNILSLDAKAGEIQQIINSMNGVVSSKVLINLAQQSVFASDQKDQSSASVVIRFKAGYRPDQHQIDTIYNLVSHSVPSLPLENITISDQNGEFSPSSLVNGGAENTATLASQQFQIKKQYEDDIRKNVKDLLGTIIGSDKVVVSVVSSLNFDKKNSTQSLVTPVNTVDQKGIEISVEKIQKSYSSDGGAAAGGVPGTGTNDIPGYPTSSNNGKSNSEENQDRVNYEVNRISNQIASSPYQVKDLTINVAVDPPVKNNPNSLTPELQDAIKRILMNIVAASLADSGQTLTDQELGKKVLVLAHTFDGRTEPPAPSLLNNPWVYGGAALALAAAFTAGFLVFRRRKQRLLEEETAAVPQVQFPTLDIDQVSSESQVRKQLETLAKKKPGEFVELLRTWLVEE